MDKNLDLEELAKADFPAERIEAFIEAGLFPELAEAFRQQGRIETAVKICQLGLAKRPDSLKGHLILGKCYLEKELYKQAKVELEKVREEVEECFSVYKLLSLVYLQEKDMDRALEALGQVLVLPEAKKKKGQWVTPVEINILQKKLEPWFSAAKTEEREKDLAEPVAAETFQTETMAQIYIRQGRLAKALDIYQELLARDPENEDLRQKYTHLAKKMAEQKKLAHNQKVISQLEKWLNTISLKIK